MFGQHHKERLEKEKNARTRAEQQEKAELEQEYGLAGIEDREALQRKLEDIVSKGIFLGADKNSEKYKIMQDACFELSRYADSLSAHFAIETGPETSLTLKNFLDSLNSTGVAVNLDPANFVMVTKEDPVYAVHTLKDYIVHTHAKDGIMLKQTEPKIIYDFFAEGGIGDLRLDEYFKEVPLGQGQVDFDAYIKALSDIGYNGYLTVEREVGDNPYGDIEMAVKFLQKYI